MIDGGVAPIPDFITHYHLADRRPALNLSDLDEAGLNMVLSGLEATAAIGVSERRFGPRYMKLRRAREDVLRSRSSSAEDIQAGEARTTSCWVSLLGSVACIATRPRCVSA